MLRSRIVMFISCLIVGVSVSQAKSQACASMGKTIHMEMNLDKPLYSNPNPDEMPVSRGSIQRMYWDHDSDCILVQSSKGLWLYPNSDLDAPPTLIKVPTTRSDTYLFTRLWPNGDLGVSVRPFAYSPDGRLIARAGRSDGPYANVVDLVNRHTGRILSTAEIPNIKQLEFTPDQTLLLALTSDDHVMGWSVDDLSKEPFVLGQDESLPPNTQNASTTPLSPSLLLRGDTLIAAKGSTIQVWDVPSHTLKHTLKGHRGTLTDLTFHPKGWLISASADGSINLWDIEQGRFLGSLTSLADHSAPILDIALNADASQIFSADSLGMLRLHEAYFPSRDVVAIAPTTLLDVSVNADGTVIATAGEDGIVRLFSYDGILMQELSGHDGAVNAVALNSSGKKLVSAGNDTTTRFWDLGDNTSDLIIEDPLWPVRDVAFMPPYQDWMSVGWDKIPRSHRVDSIYATAWVSDDEYLESIAISPDFTMFATGNWRGEIHVWPFGNLSSSRQPIRLLSGESRINALAFHPNGHLLAAASQNGSISIWDVSRPSIVLLGTMVADPNGINDLAFTPDGRSLIGVSSDVYIWDTTTWLEIGYGRGVSSPITALAIAANGEHFITVDMDGIIQRTNLYSIRKSRAAQHFGPPIDAIAFDESGTLVAVSRTQIGVWIWTPNREREGSLLRMLPDMYEPVGFSPNAEYLVSPSTGYSRKSTTGLVSPSWYDPYQINLDYFGGFSSDSRVLASLLGSISLWETDTGRRIFQMEMIEQRPVFFAFIPGRNAFLVQTDDMIMQMRRADAPDDVLHQYACDAFPEGCLGVVAVSRDYFMTSDHKIYSLETGDEIMTLALGEPPQTGLIIDPNAPKPLIVNQGALKGSASNVFTALDPTTREIVILDMRTRTVHRILPTELPSSLTVNPTGDTLYGLTYDGSLLMWPIGDAQ